MKHIKQISIFLIISILTLSLKAQKNIIFSSNDVITTELSHSDFNNLQVIQIIANAAQMPAQSVKYTVSLHIYSEIQSPTSGQHKITVTLDDYDLPNFVYYGFELPKNLGPDVWQYDLSMKKEGVQLVEYQIRNQKLQAGQTIVKNFNEAVVPKENVGKNIHYWLNIQNIKAHYSIQGYSNFKQWTEKIDRYNKASDNTISKLSEIHSIPANPDALAIIPNLDEVFGYDQIAQNALNFIEETRQQDFYRDLNLSYNDPNKLLTNLDKLYQDAQALHAACVNVIARLDVLYYDRGNLAYRQNNIDAALFNLNKSIEINPAFTPAHYLLAEIAYVNNDFDNAENILKNILINLGGDNQTISQSITLAQNLYGKYISFADGNLKQKNYDDAEFWLDKARNFCISVPQLACSQDLDQKYQQVYGSKMDFLLLEVDKFVQNSEMQQAENQLNAAIDYRNQHINYLKDETPITDRSISIYNKYVSIATDLKAKKKFDQALDNLTKAKNFCSNSKFIVCPPDLNVKITAVKKAKYEDMIATAEQLYNSGKIEDADQKLSEANNYKNANNLQESSKYQPILKKIKQKLHDNAINEGISLKKSGNYATALEKFDFAKLLEQQYNIRHNTQLGQYIFTTAKQRVFQQIDSAHIMVNINDLQSAHQLVDYAHQAAQTYGVANETDIKKAFADINNEIFTQECRNYQAQFDDYYNQALANIASKDYLTANMLLKNAEALANLHKECGIDKTNVMSKLQEINDAFYFQKLVEDAKDAYLSNNFQKSLNVYRQAVKFHADKNIQQRFGLVCKQMTDFVSERSSDFILFAANYFIDNQELDNSLLMLKKLRSNFFKAKYSKNVQTKLGAELAQKDHKQNPGENPKVAVIKYTSNDKWFKYLKKSYVKTWKKL